MTEGIDKDVEMERLEINRDNELIEVVARRADWAMRQTQGMKIPAQFRALAEAVIPIVEGPLRRELAEARAENERLAEEKVVLGSELVRRERERVAAERSVADLTEPLSDLLDAVGKVYEDRVGRGYTHVGLIRHAFGKAEGVRAALVKAREHNEPTDPALLQDQDGSENNEVDEDSRDCPCGHRYEQHDPDYRGAACLIEGCGCRKFAEADTFAFYGFRTSSSGGIASEGRSEADGLANPSKAEHVGQGFPWKALPEVLTAALEARLRPERSESGAEANQPTPDDVLVLQERITELERDLEMALEFDNKVSEMRFEWWKAAEARCKELERGREFEKRRADDLEGAVDSLVADHERSLAALVNLKTAHCRHDTEGFAGRADLPATASDDTKENPDG